MTHPTPTRLALAVALLAGAAGPATAGVITDPVGDTFNGGALDIRSASAYFDATTATLGVRFRGPVLPASAFAPNSVFGYIDLDTDRDPATGGSAPWGGPVTGGNSWLNYYIAPNPGTPAVPGPLVGIGAEFYLDVGGEAFQPGFVDLRRTSDDSLAATLPIALSGDGFTLVVPLAALGGSGEFAYAGLFGDAVALTDRLPNGSVAPVSSVVPGPASAALVGVAAGGLALVRRRRR